MNTTPLRVIPLGGLGEIGKNMMALEYKDDIIVIDAGVMFPREEMLGVDLIIPDISYLVERQHKVRGIVITHGHEDHTGALAFVLRKINVPVYAPTLALGLIRGKLKEYRVSKEAELHEVSAGDGVPLGAFRVEFFRVCHSIPDAMGLAIRTPVGTVVHTGDFKFDHTPVDGKPSDFAKLARLGEEGVLLLFSDSTYAEIPGYTPSEQVVSETLDRVIGEAQGRVIIATFASLVSRMQQVINASAKHGRKVLVVGRSMRDTAQIALKLGYLTSPPGVLSLEERVEDVLPGKVTLLTTGTQGEPTSALVRMANGAHQIEIQRGDTVVLSSSAIPGNETVINQTIDNLFRKGADVLYGRRALVHVQGHASQEELKLMLNLIRPKYFVPVHGEYRHMVLHAKLAQAMGVPVANTFVMEDGDVLELTEDSARRAEKVPAGPIYVDGMGQWAMDSIVLRDRRVMSQDGIVVVVLEVEAETGKVLGVPEIVSFGFAEEAEAKRIFDRCKRTIIETLDHSKGAHAELAFVHAQVKETVARVLYQETKRRPVIFPVAVEL